LLTGPGIDARHKLIGKSKCARGISAGRRATSARPLAADCFWCCLFHNLVIPYSGLKNKRPAAVVRTLRQAWPKL
jgi:hypothetical protein